MKTKHNVLYNNANNIPEVTNESIDLIITSPPYPMIEMWDELFIEEDTSIRGDIDSGQGKIAFEKMHVIIDKVWEEMDRVLKPGGIICINIGDATRTINKVFSLYPSHSRIINFFYSKDYFVLPEILWHKQVNSPTKYMGSGMLPVGAYTTLEHEYILVLRKGQRRLFKSEKDKRNRRKSAFFWEERNKWFSDIWFDIKGTKQALLDESLRNRSAAYPFELPYRLINMFSIKGDTILDPFLGTGTTTLAAMVAGRNSVGVEVVNEFKDIIENNIQNAPGFFGNVVIERLDCHTQFVNARLEAGKDFKYTNIKYAFPVVSKQEVDISFDMIDIVEKIDEHFIVDYS